MPRVTQPQEEVGTPPTPQAVPKVKKYKRRRKRQVRSTAPRTRRESDAGAMNLAQGAPRDMPVDGLARLSNPVIEPAAKMPNKAKAEMLAFMEEPIEVVVHSSTDKNAEPIVPVWNNGRSQYFMRNQKQTVKRKYVEVLARARTTSYTQERYKDGNGDDAIRNVPHTALHYPFSVTRDDNPRGRQWLEDLLANP